MANSAAPTMYGLLHIGSNTTQKKMCAEESNHKHKTQCLLRTLHTCAARRGVGGHRPY